jgi:hypothetical protein
VIISFRHKFIFVAIPKTATHAFRVALRPKLAPNDWEQCVLFEKKFFPVEALKNIGHGHLTCRQVKPFLLPEIWENYLKFCTVRNPFERFVSYCKFVNRDNDLMEKNPLETMKQIISDKITHDKILFRPQVEFITDEDGKLMADYICRFEDLQNDFDKVCEKLNFPKVELQKINATNPANRTEIFDSELREMVEDFYRRDFELYGY